MAPRSPARLLLVLCAAFALMLAAPAHAVQLGPEAPHSPNAEDINLAYWVMLALTVALAVALHVALIGALVRFRARRDERAAPITAGRGIMARVGAALGLVAAAIFVFGVVVTDSSRTIEPSGPDGLAAGAARGAQVGVKGLSAPATAAVELAAAGEAGGEEPASEPAAGDPLVISAIAQQWLWRFEYPGGQPGQRTFSYGELVAPVDTAVVLNVDSTDVIHSWWVPSLGGQVQAVPGGDAQTWFKADEEGVYEGSGTIFDGSAYPSLVSRVRVVSATEYEAYVEQLADDLAEAQAAVQEEVSAEAAAAQPPAEEGTR